MFVELHIIQNFAPSNLNRSDTGSPKDCEFGGVRRARISSQCLKRAMRDAFKQDPTFDTSHKAALAVRTKLLLGEITKRLVQGGKQEEEAKQAATIVLNAGNVTINDDGKTEFLLYLGEEEIQKITKLCIDQWPELMKVQVAFKAVEKVQAELKEAQDKVRNARRAIREAEKVRVQEQKAAAEEEQRTAQKLIDDARKKLEDEQKKAKASIPDDMRKAMLALLDGGKAADLAFFGRMIATLPEKNIDAASQVAHAISTHKSGVDFDFYTSVDDLLPQGETGAGMMGTIEFNSACFYRYANIDVELLRENLGGEEDLARDTIEAFVRATVNVVPTGKQNSMAAQNPPSFVFAVVRKAGLWSLVNAFVKPVRPKGDSDLVEESVERLDEYWGHLTTAYGNSQIKDKCYMHLASTELAKLNGSRVDNLDTLVKRVRDAVQFESKAS
jgi:CRISPR system Cascade subunit CasC